MDCCQRKTDHIRQSKGSRTEKGRNKAIAEWKTDSSNGKYGFFSIIFFGNKNFIVNIPIFRKLYTF